MTQTMTDVLCADFCSTPTNHPDGLCVQADTVITDAYGSRTHIAAFLNRQDEAVGVYLGSLIFTPNLARSMAAALLNSADAADRALDMLNAAGR